MCVCVCVCVCVCARPHGGRVSTSTCRAGGGGLVTKLCPALAIPWTVACRSHLSMGFSRPEYWSGLPFPSPGDLPDPGVEARSPKLQADSLPAELQGKPCKGRGNAIFPPSCCVHSVLGLVSLAFMGLVFAGFCVYLPRCCKLVIPLQPS